MQKLGLLAKLHLRLGASFSEAVLEAARLGFTEPDPRDDLSGGDVQRKAAPPQLVTIRAEAELEQ